jgi:CO/xanthine dehydrogenase FAD-binding subunit
LKVLQPETLDEACALLAADHSAIPLAGGTDLYVHWPEHLDAHDRTYLDLSGLAGELRTLRLTDDVLEIGALTTYFDVLQGDVLQDADVLAAFPLLGQAARQVGAVQIQARGTWAGNIVNASPAADGVPVLMAYDATVELVSAAGREEVALADFYLGYKKMRRRPDQLIRSIRLPRRAYDVEIFEKVGARRAQAITKTGTAVVRSQAGWRVVAISMAATTCRCPALEKLLTDNVAIESPDDLLPAIRQDVAPIDDVRSTAAYREVVLARVLYWALRQRVGWS